MFGDANTMDIGIKCKCYKKSGFLLNPNLIFLGGEVGHALFDAALGMTNQNNKFKYF